MTKDFFHEQTQMKSILIQKVFSLKWFLTVNDGQSYDCRNVYSQNIINILKKNPFICCSHSHTFLLENQISRVCSLNFFFSRKVLEFFSKTDILFITLSKINFGYNCVWMVIKIKVFLSHWFLYVSVYFSYPILKEFEPQSPWEPI